MLHYTVSQRGARSREVVCCGTRLFLATVPTVLGEVVVIVLMEVVRYMQLWEALTFVGRNQTMDENTKTRLYNAGKRQGATNLQQGQIVFFFFLFLRFDSRRRHCSRLLDRSTTIHIREVWKGHLQSSAPYALLCSCFAV